MQNERHLSFMKKHKLHPMFMSARSCLLACACLGLYTAHGSAPLEIGDRRELFLDDLLVERLEGDIARRFHEPVAREIVMTFDQSWEGNTCLYFSVFKDGDLYRMYYRASGYAIESGQLRPTTPGRRAYLESEDGIHWTRPVLELVEHSGSKENNLLGWVGNNGVFFRDENPAAPPEARYKAITTGRDHRDDNIGGGHNITVWQSADGIRWELMQREAIYDKRHRGLGEVSPDRVRTWLDSQNTAFWCPNEKRYVMYYRVYTVGGRPQTADWLQPANNPPPPLRHIEKAVSDDFLNWERVGLIDVGKELPSITEQFYTNGIVPYHRAPHLYIAVPGMYDGSNDREWTPGHDLLPDLERRRLESSVAMRAGTALTDSLLMWSRDGRNFDVSPETFLRPGPERPGSWMYGSHFASWGIVETDSNLPGADPELSFYVSEFYRKGPAVKLRRYTLRLDGFASLRAARQGGELITPPVIFEGAALSMNFATSASGSVQVELQDADGKPIPGFTLADSVEMFGDTVARNAMWEGEPDLSALAGEPVRLRFVMRDADLYSIQFN